MARSQRYRNEPNVLWRDMVIFWCENMNQRSDFVVRTWIIANHWLISPLLSELKGRMGGYKHTPYGKIISWNNWLMGKFGLPTKGPWYPPGVGGWFAKTFPISSKSRKMFSHKELKFSLFSYILRERFRCFKWSKTVNFPGASPPDPQNPIENLVLCTTIIVIFNRKRIPTHRNS